MVGAIRSIDGYYQWMETAPPYPRRTGFALDANWPLLHSYGYSSANGKGFRIWQDLGARKKVFKRLFKGPLSPAVESPLGLGFLQVLDANYPYRACELNPFPRIKIRGNGAIKINDPDCIDFNSSIVP